MPQTGSYLVTKKVSLPQPHVTYVTKPSENTSWSSWTPFIIVGILALSFMICLHIFGGPKIFPTAVDPYSGMIPTIKQGILQLYPLSLVLSDGIKSRYSTTLPPENLTGTVTVLDNLLNSYPESHGNMYKNCWLENPSPESPCFFDSSWISEVCTKNYSYGYESNGSYYNPCFVMKLEKTKDWIPLPVSIENVPSSVNNHFDRGFMPVHCYTKDQNISVKITVYPAKGFSLLFFPVSKFNSKKYLAPFVAVKVEGLKEGDNVTLECSIITRNAFLLWNNGKAVITFMSGSSS